MVSGELHWQDRAVCRQVDDPELFFPVGNRGAAAIQIQMAKRVCNTCEVRQECLDWAMDHHEDSGVWGGLSEDERRSLKRRGRQAVARL